jgi:hypothetical protein
LIYSGPVQGVRGQMSAGMVYWAKVQGSSAAALEILKARPEITEAVAVDGQIKVTFINHEADPALVPEALVRAGVRLTGYWEDELGLEEVFLRVTRGDTQ